MKGFLSFGYVVVLCLVVVSMAAPVAMAQGTATVTGTVADGTGARIPGVEVTATNGNTNIATLRLTGPQGGYTIPNLQPGPYTIVAVLPGFENTTLQVQLAANQTYRFDMVMQVAGTATQVEVVSDADALLATTTSSVGDALPAYELEALPLATRDIFDLLQTTPGVVRTEGGDSVQFAGTRNSAVNTTRDGIVVSDGRYLDWNGAFSATFTSSDLVEEVQVSVGTVDASAGRGSGQVRLQTRSGTNDYHGAVFYSTNNSAFNANTWFNNQQGLEPDWTNRQQFGGRLGGPILQNKAFFFVLAELQRFRARDNVTNLVWTDEARTGLFRYWPGVDNQDAAAGNPSVDQNGNPIMPTGATGNLAEINLFSDVGNPYRGTGITSNAYIQETLNRMPSPNNFTVGDGLNTAGISWVRRRSGSDNAAGTSQDVNRNNVNVRFDYQATQNNRMNFVYTYERKWADSGFVNWPDQLYGTSWEEPRILTAGWTSTVTPSVVNEFRFGYRRTSWHGRPAYADGCCLGNDELLGSNDLTEKGKVAQSFFELSNGYPYIPNLQSLGGSLWVTVPNFTTIRSQQSPLWQFSDSVSFIMGDHSFQAGWEGVWADSDGWNTGGLEPRVNIGDGGFPADELVGFTDMTTNNRNLARGILNDLSGSVGSLEQTYVVNDPQEGFIDIQTTIKQNLNFHQDDWAAYIRDNWNFSPNLTLTWGLRWDVYGVPYEAKGLNVAPKDNNFYGLSNGALTEFIAVGKNSPNPDIPLYKKDWNNIAPSFGFSYRVPWLTRQTVVRGGYGISYSGAPTFLQYDFGPGRQQGKSFATASTPAAYTALPGTTNGSALEVDFPLPLTIQPFGTVQLNSAIRSSGAGVLYAYADDRRVPYIQNFNLSVETEIARDTNLSVAYLGTIGVALWGGQQVNEVEIMDNGLLDAFNVTRAGMDAPLFNTMFTGIVDSNGDPVDFGSGTCGVVNGTTCTGSSVLRNWSFTDDYIADGEVAGLAEFLTETNRATGIYGGLLQNVSPTFIKLNPAFNQVDLYDNSDASNYHALQVQVTKRLSSGFSGSFAYTWSKAMGNSVTSTFRARQDQSFGVRDPNNRALQWGIVPFSRTHQFNAHGVWELPFGPGKLLGGNSSGTLARFIEGWQLSSIFSWDSGTPIPVTTSLETLAAEDDANTPNVLGAFPRDLGEVTILPNGNVTYLDGYQRVTDPNNYYGSDPDNLTAHRALYQIVDPSGNPVLGNPAPGTTGDMMYNYLTGPGRLQLDAAMLKTVQLREGTSLTLRIDAINMLNTPQWSNPNLNINSSNFGRITNAGGARQFTLNARIDF